MNEITNISPQQLCDLVAEGRQVDLIDVRTPEEFAEVRAEGAVSVPLDTVDVAAIEAARKCDEDQPTFVICKVGGRSMMACEFLAQHGMKNLVNVAGGTDEWVKAGLPVHRGK